MEIIDGQIIIETRVDAKEYIDTRIAEVLALQEDILAIQATIDAKLAEIQSLQQETIASEQPENITNQDPG